MIDAMTTNVRLDIDQGTDKCLVKLNGQMVNNLEAISVTMGADGTVATILFRVDDLHISHEINRIVGMEVDPASVPVGN